MLEASLEFIKDGEVTRLWWDEGSGDLKQLILNECKRLCYNDPSTVIVNVEITRDTSSTGDALNEFDFEIVDSFVKVYDPTAPHLTFLR